MTRRAKRHLRLNQVAGAGPWREPDRRTKRILEQHARAFEVRRRHVCVHTRWYVIQLGGQSQGDVWRDLVTDPRAHSVPRAGEGELWTCLCSPQQIHLDLQQLQVVERACLREIHGSHVRIIRTQPWAQDAWSRTSEYVRDLHR